MAKKSSNGPAELEQLKKENEELRKKLAELESLINNEEDETDETLSTLSISLRPLPPLLTRYLLSFSAYPASSLTGASPK